MATDFDRDDRLHGLLRDTLRSQPASGPCIDTATLAAWTEGALTPEETAAADAHLAACARCRELAAALSTMTEAASAPAAAVVPFTPRPTGHWKVIVSAMGAVAASVLIWVAVRDGSPPLDTTSAANRAAESQAGGQGGNVPAPPGDASARRAESTDAAQSRADTRYDAQLRQGQQGQQQQRALAAAEAKVAQENSARVAATRQSSAKPSPAPVEPPPAATAPPPPAAVPTPAPPASPPPTATAGNARASTATGPPPSTINTDITGIKQSDPMRSSETFFAMAIVAEFVAGADLQAAEGQQGQAFGAVADRSRAGGAGRGGAGGRGGGGATTAGGGVAQKNADGFFSGVPVRWRLRGGSPAPPVSVVVLERSKDGGVTWEAVALPAQTTTPLTGGSAPANTVCWLVGRAGTVLLSTDGTTFRQVAKPADVDLVSVRATDARSATVRTADGRAFATSDGGLTWTR